MLLTSIFSATNWIPILSCELFSLRRMMLLSTDNPVVFSFRILLYHLSGSEERTIQYKGNYFLKL